MLKTKRAVVNWVVLSVLLTAGIIGFRSCQRAGWEALLRGPYSGTPFTGLIDQNHPPASVLKISRQLELQVYEVEEHPNPILVLRSNDTTVVWARMIIPERLNNDGMVERAAVREMRLKRLSREGSGHEVLFTCDWDWGGRESGLIDLEDGYGFKSVRISW